MSTSVIDDLKRAKIMELLDQGQRIDGRAFDEPRKLTVEINAIPKANGSARVRLGDSEAVCGVKIQPDRPFPDMGDKGIFICTAELLPLSHPSVETGPPGPDVIELARVVDIFAKRLQTQETMTQQIANCIEKSLKPKGVAVYIEALHQCMTTRGVNKPNVSTITSCFLGEFKLDKSIGQRFTDFIK